MKIPKYVNRVLNELHNNGYSAYIVGGAIRDFLLGKTPHDFDIATSAIPEEILSVFSDYKTLTTGIKHGTIGVISSGKLLEVTTFRIDEDYSDFRHPSNVRFTNKLKDDLSRRDFTINALAYDGEVIDYFGGCEDLEKGIIRCVGDPNIRFTEDVLRILRALRFSCQLNFTILENTKEAIFKYKDLLKNISKERIAIEVNKMLSSDITVVLEEYLPVFQVIFPDLNKNNITNKIEKLKKSNNNLVVRTAILFDDFPNPDDNLDNLRTSKLFKVKVLNLLENKNIELSENPSHLAKLLINIHLEDLLNIEEYQNIFETKTDIKKVMPLIQNIPTKLNDLKINGHDLIKLGFQQTKIISEILNELLV